MKQSTWASNTTGLGLLAVRWLTRLVGLASCAVMAVMAYSHRTNPLQMAAADLLLFAFFPTAVGLGLVLGWRWEVAGGLLALAGWAAFQATHSFLVGTLCRDWQVNVLSLPGLLFVVSGLLRARAMARSAAAPAAAPQHGSASSEGSQQPLER